MSHDAPVTELRRYPGFAFITCACLFLLYTPILVVSIYSFNSAKSITVWQGFSLNWYLRLGENSVIRNAAFNSLAVALTAASLATIVATIAAIGMHRGREAIPGASAASALLRFPLAVPEIITAISSLIFFVSVGVPLGFPAIILAHTVFSIPFAYLPISSSLGNIDQSLDEASRDLYASRLETLRLVLLPLMLPSIFGGFCLAFIVSLDDFVIANFLTGPDSATLPVVIYGMARTGFTPEINAVATLMLTASIAILLIYYYFSSTKKSTSSSLKEEA